jgi:hypothetical protein
MTKRLDIVSTYTGNVDEFQQALAHIEGAAKKRMPRSAEEVSKPAMKRATSAPKSVFSPALKLKPTKSLELPRALQDALRNANVSTNHESIEALLSSLSTIQLEREHKLREHYDSSTSSTHGTLAERFSRADSDLKTILNGLYSHTPFQQVHLTNPELDDELQKMEKELDEANDRLLIAEANELSLSDPKVRAFIAKYGK